jgi:hypothetical protein
MDDDMLMPENARMREIDDETLGGMRDDDDGTFEVYAAWFKREPLHDVLAAVERTHEAIWQAFLLELQWAASLLYKSPDPNARVAGYLRGYRAVDSYDVALTHAVVEAFAAPFLELFDKPIKPWAFFQRDVLKGIRARAFDEAFRGPEVRTAIAAFYGTHGDARNHVVHGTKIPTHDEFRTMLLAAINVYDLADHALHPHLAGGAPHIPVLDPQDYPHDNYRPAVVVNPQPGPA